MMRIFSGYVGYVTQIMLSLRDVLRRALRCIDAE